MFCDIFFPLDYFVHPPTMSQNTELGADVECQELSQGVVRIQPSWTSSQVGFGHSAPNSWLLGLRTLPGLLCLALGPLLCCVPHTPGCSPCPPEGRFCALPHRERNRGAPGSNLQAAGQVGQAHALCEAERASQVPVRPCESRGAEETCSCWGLVEVSWCVPLQCG